MNEQENSTGIRRILVGLDASTQSQGLIEAATRLAVNLNTELLGIFVEDINLLRLATLPFAREIVYASTTGRKLDSISMERSLKAQSRRIKNIFEKAAQRASVQQTFHIARGNIVAELLAITAATDLLVLGKGTLHAASDKRIGSTAQAIIAQAGCNLILLQQDLGAEHPVIVFFDGSAASQRATVTAIRLLKNDHHRLLILLAADTEETQQALREDAGRILAAHDSEAGFIDLKDDSIESLITAVNRQRAHLFIIDPACQPWQGGQQEILSRIDCPIMLYR